MTTNTVNKEFASFYTKRIINDLWPLLKKGGSLPAQGVFLGLCVLYSLGLMNNLQFKEELRKAVSN